MIEDLAEMSRATVQESTIQSPAEAQAAAARSSKFDWLAYIEIARPDHWFKNVFMLIGVVLAMFCQESFSLTARLGDLIVGFIATCIIASSNYVINEVLDATMDRHHPVKRNRPIPSGRVKLPLAYAEWLVLGVVGLALAATINVPFLLSAAALLFMGLVYNVPPIRTKQLPYLDVLSESVNNPLRLLLGWFAVTSDAVPPVSLVLSYFLIGAFFMASKRFAEYRSIGDKATAAAYRSSFQFYDENRLLVSMFTYACGSALFLGVFIIRYHLELILLVPFIAVFFGYYLHVSLKKNSAAQNPERLYRERGLMIYLAVCLVLFLLVMFVEIPWLYELFNVAPSKAPALWRIS
jgi:decaprenyl-phosphate phosphoribosyltransferase